MQRLLEQNLPGLSVAVESTAGVVWAEGFGLAVLRRGRPSRRKSGFRIGTASKVLTSAAVGVLLLEDGRLKLDDVIQTYVPEFPEKRSARDLAPVHGACCRRRKRRWRRRAAAVGGAASGQSKDCRPSPTVLLRFEPGN